MERPGSFCPQLSSSQIHECQVMVQNLWCSKLALQYHCYCTCATCTEVFNHNKSLYFSHSCSLIINTTARNSTKFFQNNLASFLYSLWHSREVHQHHEELISTYCKVPHAERLREKFLGVTARFLLDWIMKKTTKDRRNSYSADHKTHECIELNKGVLLTN